MSEPDPWRPVRRGFIWLTIIIVAGTIGYLILGLSLIDAIYQTVTTVSTVGFREVGTATGAFKVLTMALILLGVGTLFYTLTVALETLLEGRVTDHLRRRRMTREIDQMTDHVIVCGWGRIGRRASRDLATAGRQVVVVDRDPKVAESDLPFVVGDATDEDVLAAAGLQRASTLIAALTGDSDNVYLTLSARALHPEIFIIARARIESAEARLAQAGADRVVNPQAIGGTRVAALTLQPHVVDFLDIVMHDQSLEFRLEEVAIAPSSPLAGTTIREAGIRDRTGAMVMGLREMDGTFLANPAPDVVFSVGQVLIGIGTPSQLSALRIAAGGPAS